MEIIIPGRPPGERMAQTDCRHCHCRFKFSAKEAEFVSDQRDVDAYKIACPECSDMCWIPAKEFV